MELFTGVCGICSSSNLILNSEYSENYCNLLYSHFENELNISSESKTYFNLCPMCVYQITLVDSKKNLLARKYVEDEKESIDKCALCEQNGDIFKIADTNFLKKCKQSTKDIVSVCASCYYVIEVNNVLKEHVMKKLFVKDESTDNQNCLSKQRIILKRRKSTSGLGGSSFIVSEDINMEYNTSETKKRRKNWNVTSINDSVDTSLVRRKRRRSKDLCELLDDHLENLNSKHSKISESNFEQLQEESLDWSLQSISHLSPICKLDIDIEEEHKQDKKMYNCIPFVKMQNLRETSVKDNCNYVCSFISQKPIIQVSRTPPIKIKAIKNVNLTKDKKKGNKSSIVNLHSNVEIPEQKLVVKVERMKLEISKEEITPKKKKRVHFNDIPTIIFTDDDYHDDCKSKRNTRISSRNTGINQTSEDETKKIELEKSDSEELITLVLDESDDESKRNTRISSRNTGINQTSEDETKKIEEEKSDSEELISLILDESDDESQTDTMVASNEESVVEIEDPINNQVLEESEIMDAESEKLEKSEDEKIHGETDELKDCEESSVKTSQEDGKDEKESLDECEIIHSQDETQGSAEKNCYDKNIDQEDEEPNCSNQIIDIQGVSSDKLDELTSCNQINDLQGVSSDKLDEITSCNQINDLQGVSSDKLLEMTSKEIIDIQEEGSSDKSDRNTPLTEIIVPDKESSPKSTENIDKDLEDEEKENSDTNQLLKDSDTEKDSLDGFEVIDQEDGDLIVESTEKVSSEKPDDSIDDIDAIDALVKKYCGQKDTNSEVSENDISETGKKNEETVLDNGEEGSQEKTNDEKNSNNRNSNEENETAEEDFGSLIDEVQKCLTSTKDLLDKSEESTEDQCEDNEPNTIEKGDVLNKLLDENRTNTPNSSQTESLNGNKELIGKDSDENIGLD